MRSKPPIFARHSLSRAGLPGVVFGLFCGLGVLGDGAVDWLKGLLIAVSVALVFRWAFGEPYRIPTGSMEPTLHGDPKFLKGDRVFINKWVYGVRVPFANKRLWRGADPLRWDIIVFKTVEPGAEHKTLIKRVVGLPGERIHIADGTVYANGEPLPLPDSMPPVQYTTAGSYGVRAADQFSVVPPDHYLLLGDNSASSRDGRFFGWVPNENIVGRAFCIMWPPSRVRDFTGFTQTWWWRTLIGILSVVTIVRLFLGRTWRVRSSTLGDPLHDGERVYVNRIAYGLPLPFTRTRLFYGRAPRRGEFVLYHAPGDKKEPVLGRVAALPGDPIRGKGGKTSLVPDGRYLMSGDSGVRTVHRKDLIGPVTAVWWPPQRWRRVRT